MNTEYRYTLLRKHLKSCFDGRLLNSIRPIEWQRFLNNFAAGKDRKTSRKRSKDIVSKMNSYVRSMVKSAINDQIIFTDFTFGAKIGGVRSSNKIKVLDTDNFASVKALSADKASYLSVGAFAVYLGAMTGMRVSEVLALTWSDIDTDKKLIHVSRSWDHQYGSGFKPTKTESSVRDVEVSSDVLNTIERVRKEQTAAYLKTGYRDPDKMMLRNQWHTVITDTACNKALAILQNEADISLDKQITFHGLRHSHVSYLISKGIDIYYISKRLGHSDITITMRVYGHLLDSKRKLEATKATAAMDQL